MVDKLRNLGKTNFLQVAFYKIRTIQSATSVAKSFGFMMNCSVTEWINMAPRVIACITNAHMSDVNFDQLTRQNWSSTNKRATRKKWKKKRKTSSVICATHGSRV